MGGVWISSFLQVSKNDSDTALSKQMPVLPRDLVILLFWQ